ncbi:hypothetical protein D3C81_2056270 [compost metagenome]
MIAIRSAAHAGMTTPPANVAETAAIAKPRAIVLRVNFIFSSQIKPRFPRGGKKGKAHYALPDNVT